jgi:hypothetical protein
MHQILALSSDPNFFSLRLQEKRLEHSSLNVSLFFFFPATKSSVQLNDPSGKKDMVLLKNDVGA